MFEKWKLRKYKDILFVDSENVGYLLPSILPASTFVYMFVSDQHVIEKLKCQTNSQIKIVDISQSVHEHTKNAMDFCIVSKVSEMLRYISSKQKLVIVSKDKGYDAVITYIKSNHQNLCIERFPYPLIFYHIHDEFLNRIYDKLSERTIRMIGKCHSMKELRKNLSKKQKKLFCIKRYIDPISSYQVMVEYDIYKHVYVLYCTGTIKQYCTTFNAAINEYKKLKDEVIIKSKKYYSKELFKKAKQLKIHKYIEEAYANHQTLQECLMRHLGNEEGMQMFLSYIH